MLLGALCALLALGAPHAGADPATPDPTEPGRVVPAAAPLGTDLSIELIEGARIPRTGGTGTVRAIVRNGAPAVTATGVTAVYVPPANVQFDGAAGGSGTCHVDNGMIVCAVADLVAGASAEVTIGLRGGPGNPGSAAGYFMAPRSAEWNPNAGELLHRRWNTEVGGQGESVTHCWPVANESPAMDVAGGGTGLHQECDGVNDAPALTPDVEAVLDQFPDPYSVNAAHSWEWRTRITPGASGDYDVCSDRIDDGGYVAITPAGDVADDSDIVLDVPAWGGTRSASVALVAGTTYEVLIRVVNRGNPGIGNGNNAPGGWGYFRMSHESATCSDPASALGTQSLMISPTTVDVETTPAAQLQVIGSVTDPAAGTSRARITNLGPDSDDVLSSVRGGAAVAPFNLTDGQDRVVVASLAPTAAEVSAEPRWAVRGAASLPPQG